MYRFFALSLFLMLSGLCTESLAQLPEEFYDQKIQDFEFPTGLSFDDNGQMYIWEKTGLVRVIDPNGNLLPEPLVDFHEEVANWKDHGLMAMVLDNDFLSNGYYYLLYAMDPHYYNLFGTPEYHPDTTSTFTATFGRVVRYTADPASNFTQTIPDSRLILLGETHEDGIPLFNDFHGLGTLLMGLDGTLLISNGENTHGGDPKIGGEDNPMLQQALQEGIISPDQDLGSYRAQYLGSLNGKILRIDAETGEGLPSNPFYNADAPRSAQSRVWSLGFRNPYRMVLKPETGSHSPEDGNPGTILVGDVGNGAWEEINVVTKGGQNFGWPISEGIKINWGFWTTDVPDNPMASNPLADQGICEQEFFTFRDLLKRPKPDHIPVIPNPCDPNQPIPAEAFPMIESLPLIIWNNARWNQPTRAQVPFFKDNGGIGEINIDDPESSVSGEVFEGFSSLAGLFYNGDSYPEEYQGKYFGVDFSGWIKVFEFDEEDHLVSVERFHDDSRDIIHLSFNPADGNLYYVDLQGGLHMISYGGNPPPVAVIKADQYFGPSPLTVGFDGTDSYDSNLSVESYEWDFGDGSTSTDPSPEHTFSTSSSEPTSFTVKLTVTDTEGASTTTEKIVSLNNSPPEVEITSFKDGDLYPTKVATLLPLEAQVTDAEHKEEDLSYEWRVYFHHNDHFHPEPVDFNHRTFTLISPLGCEEELYWYRVELTVTDPAGLATVVTQEVHPYCGEPFLEWTELKGQADGSQIKLEWHTQSEDQLLSFEVQRSSDFFDFETLGTVEPINSSSGHQYVFYDVSPRKGNNIYRIKVLNTARAFDFSNLATVVFPRVPDVKIFPNPAGTSFNLEVKETKASTIQLELFNPAGIRLFRTEWPVDIGEDLQRTVLTGFLQNGLYYYRLINGEEEQTGSLVILK